MALSKFEQDVMSPNDADGMANSVDPDQTAPLGAVWSGSTLFAQAYLSENLGSLQYFLFMIFFCNILCAIFEASVQNSSGWGNVHVLGVVSLSCVEHLHVQCTYSSHQKSVVWILRGCYAGFFLVISIGSHYKSGWVFYMFRQNTRNDLWISWDAKW